MQRFDYDKICYFKNSSRMPNHIFSTYLYNVLRFQAELYIVLRSSSYQISRLQFFLLDPVVTHASTFMADYQSIFLRVHVQILSCDILFQAICILFTRKFICGCRLCWNPNLPFEGNYPFYIEVGWAHPLQDCAIQTHSRINYFDLEHRTNLLEAQVFLY